MQYRNVKCSVLLLLSILSASAHAYIDPGSGSAIMSAIIGFFVAVSLAVKTYWYKIKSLFNRSETNSSPADEEQQESQARPEKPQGSVEEN